ncbi:serine hydrolase domain-containing protein [Nocardiopsis ansamitocini]|uniref:Serine hydrolase n=1 Tax=Nocardiopsis ansamitocini TaxID=1670832 RepID=A0A9W6UL38_9ACTN|nr:serine hydrolase domain-containing protein [Nocardiopsis ansamitocini]GLU50268.1 serine hydrolase [Nocardiopsis ansamitocini]
MNDLAAVQSWLDDELPALRAEYGVPGCSVAVLAGGAVAAGATGVLNLRTGAPVSTGSLFQIGSVTKLWTTALVMQLVEAGRVDLDAPVRTYLPGFRVVDAQAGASTTPRHLLSHTSGIHGDAFIATSRGDDAVARYVDEVVPTLVQDIAPGSVLSYCNSGYTVLGRIAEVLHGKPYHVLVRELIGAPLGLERWATVPEEALLHSTAVGHVPTGADGALEPAPFWNLPASLGPAGAMLAMDARSLLAFADAHIGDETLVKTQTLEAMWRPQATIPGGLLGSTHWGLGWMLFDWDGHRVVGHDGGTYGQTCSFRMAPDAGIAVVSQVNSTASLGVHRRVMERVFDELAGITVPAPETPPARPEPADRDRFSGRFATPVTELEIGVADDGTVHATETALTEEARLLSPEAQRTALVRLDDDRLIGTEAPTGVHEVFTFLGGGAGEPATHVFRGGRALPRVAA